MIDKLNYLLTASLKLDELKETLATKNKWKEESSINCFLIPCAVLIAIEIFLTYCLYTEDFRLEVAIIKPLFFVIKCFVSFFFFSKLSEYVCENYIGMNEDRMEMNHLFFLIYFSYLLITAALTLLPSMFFFKFFLAYLFYQAWQISNRVFEDIDDNQKMRFTILVPAIMLLINVIVDKVLCLLVPNIPI